MLKYIEGNSICWIEFTSEQGAEELFRPKKGAVTGNCFLKIFTALLHIWRPSPQSEK
jgi:hypothetical protein